VRVPGATIHYQVRGAGPVLLIVMGGGGDADAGRGIAEPLSDRFTVVTYDRRGLSRSTLDDPDERPTIRTHSDAAPRLLAEITDEPARVFGTSLGALIALDLVARHPEQVSVLVAHEPPLPQLLSGAERAEAARLGAAIESGTRGPEWEAVMRSIAVDHGDREPDVDIPTPSAQAIANSEFFRLRDARAAHRHVTDLDALRDATTLIVPAAGERSGHAFPHRAALALAERLGTEPAILPGDHAGFATRPRAFAAALATLLDDDGRINRALLMQRSQSVGGDVEEDLRVVRDDG